MNLFTAGRAEPRRQEKGRKRIFNSSDFEVRLQLVLQSDYKIYNIIKNIYTFCYTILHLTSDA